MSRCGFFVCSQADNEIIAIKFPPAVGRETYTLVLELKLRDYVGQKGGLLCGTLLNDRGRPIHRAYGKIRMQAKQRTRSSEGWRRADHNFAVATVALMIFFFVAGFSLWIFGNPGTSAVNPASSTLGDR